MIYWNPATGLTYYPFDEITVEDHVVAVHVLADGLIVDADGNRLCTSFQED